MANPYNYVSRRLKHLFYGYCPGFSGVLPYYGERLYFPRGSRMVRIACRQGVFEQDNLRLLQAAARPGSWYFDVGANIGLMAAPLLQANSALTVASVEASPATASYLARSIAESSCQKRWHFVPKALGASEGEADFFVSQLSHGIFDGLRNTGRGRGVHAVKVPLTTLDTLWMEFGRPDVCLVKIDVEGGETGVLNGAAACLKATRPCILLEWNATNLAAFGISAESLFDLADKFEYGIFSTPGLSAVTDKVSLKYWMSLGETFFLLPRPLPAPR